MFDFTRKKFLSLPFCRKHKKCAELLYNIYERQITQKEWKKEWSLYLEFLEWMDISIDPALSIPNLSIQKIADQYHEHLQQAQIFKKEHHLLPQIRKGDSAHAEAAWPIAIYLDHIRSAYNVGSIVRTVEAFSLGSLYCSPQTPFITHKQVQDSAMGCDQWISCYQGVDIASLPRPLIALETGQNALSLYEMIFPPSFTLILGNEEYGCSDEILKMTDYIVQIPLRGHKNSLNVANAFAIAAGEISRQKSLYINIKSLHYKEYYDKKK